MSLMVYQIEDPDTPKVIHSGKATLGTDDSLDTSQLGFVKEGDVFLGCTHSKGTHVYDQLIHPSLPPIIPPHVWKSSVKFIDGSAALPLISLADYNKITDRRHTALSHQVTERQQVSSQATIPQHPILHPLEQARTSSQITIELPRRTYRLPRPVPTTHPEPPEVIILIRQLRDYDDPNVPVVRTWEVKLERDFTLDTSKLAPNKPDENYYSRATNGKFQPLNLNSQPIVDPSYLEYYLHDMPGLALPVLLLMTYSDYQAFKRQPHRISLS